MNDDYLLDVSGAKEEVTKVVFRKWKGEIIALFPEEPGDRLAATCLSYMNSGQHGAADYNMIISTSRPATASEYESLRKELESIGYNLKVLKRSPNDAYSKRQLVIWKAERQAEIAQISQLN